MKELPCPEAPMRKRGLILEIICGRSCRCCPSILWAHFFFPLESSEDFRREEMSPFESTSQIFFLASSKLLWKSFSMHLAIKSAIPRLASPAPKNRNVSSSIFLLDFFNVVKIPARQTEAVPVIIYIGMKMV